LRANGSDNDGERGNIHDDGGNCYRKTGRTTIASTTAGLTIAATAIAREDRHSGWWE